MIVVASNDNESSQVTLLGFSICVSVPVILGLTRFLTMAEAILFFFLRFSLRVSLVRARSLLRVFSCAHLFPCACYTGYLRLTSSDRPKFLAFSKQKEKQNNDVVKPFFT